MSITEDTVRYVAKLSGLALTDDETKKMQTELSDILNYVEHLSEVNTLGVVETSHVHGVTNFFRDDVVKDSFKVEDVAKNAPSYGASGFRVPKIIG